MSYADVLREDADRFVTTVAVVAEDAGRSALDVAVEAMADALARLQESGVLSKDHDE